MFALTRIIADEGHNEATVLAVAARRDVAALQDRAQQDFNVNYHDRLDDLSNLGRLLRWQAFDADEYVGTSTAQYASDVRYQIEPVQVIG